MRYCYPANLEWEPDRSTVTVTFDDLPGATFGATEAEALARAEDLLETALSFYTGDGFPVPKPAPAKERSVVHPRPPVTAKMALHHAVLSAGLTNVELDLDENGCAPVAQPAPPQPYWPDRGRAASARQAIGNPGAAGDLTGDFPEFRSGRHFMLRSPRRSCSSGWGKSSGAEHVQKGSAYVRHAVRPPTGL